jgi:23S rRNA G2445 N2-methylase RlmL
MCGSATFAIEVSSTSMNVASVTVNAITQGLM